MLLWNNMKHWMHIFFKHQVLALIWVQYKNKRVNQQSLTFQSFWAKAVSYCFCIVFLVTFWHISSPPQPFCLVWYSHPHRCFHRLCFNAYSILSPVETFTRETQWPLLAPRRSVADWLWNHHVDNALVPCQQLNRRALVQHKMPDNRFPWLESALRSLTVVHCVVLSSCFSPSQKQSNTPINDANFNTWTQKITGLVVGLKIDPHQSYSEEQA